eukprot:scaffold434_cov186-Pinguiococcus_pyrenoidosus.AAC.74
MRVAGRGCSTVLISMNENLCAGIVCCVGEEYRQRTAAGDAGADRPRVRGECAHARREGRASPQGGGRCTRDGDHGAPGEGDASAASVVLQRYVGSAKAATAHWSRRCYDVVAAASTSTTRTTSIDHVPPSLCVEDSFEAVQGETVQLLMLSIADPVWTQRNQPALLDLPAVRALKESSEQKWLVELLETLLRKTLDDFEAFQAANADKIKGANLDVENLMKAARLLAICALANEKDVLTYGDVAKVLKVEEDEVELWIVNAISAGLLEARLDQLERTVTIQSVSFRHFGREQWLILQVLNGSGKTVATAELPQGPWSL